MGQGAHSNREGAMGEALDRVQKLVEEMGEAVMSSTQTAIRVRAYNRVVERSLMGQQFALGTDLAPPQIRTQIVQQSRFRLTGGCNPFISLLEQNESSEGSSSGRRTRETPVTPSPNRSVAPRRQRQSTASSSARGVNQDGPEEEEADAVGVASQNIANTITRSLRSARRAVADSAATNRNTGSGTTGAGHQFMHEGAIAHFASYLDPLAAMISRTVDHREIESMTRLHSMLSRQLDRSIARNADQPLGQRYLGIRNQYEHRAQSRFVEMSDLLQDNTLRRLRDVENERLSEELDPEQARASGPIDLDNCSTSSDEVASVGLTLRRHNVDGGTANISGGRNDEEVDDDIVDD